MQKEFSDIFNTNSSIEKNEELSKDTNNNDDIRSFDSIVKTYDDQFKFNYNNQLINEYNIDDFEQSDDNLSTLNNISLSTINKNLIS